MLFKDIALKLIVYSGKGQMANDSKKVKDSNIPQSKERRKVKFEVYGEEMVEKIVKLSGNSGRVYLPPDWVGSRVKIIRID